VVAQQQDHARPSSALDQFLKRRLAAVACATNGCAYCTAHSCAMLKNSPGNAAGWGMSESELQQMIVGDSDPKNEFERVCFDYGAARSALWRARRDSSSGSSRSDAAADRRARLRCGLLKFYNTVHDSPHPGQPGCQDTGYVDLRPAMDDDGSSRSPFDVGHRVPIDCAGTAAVFAPPATVSRAACSTTARMSAFRLVS
jgi:hypothetical protein